MLRLLGQQFGGPILGQEQLVFLLIIQSKLIFSKNNAIRHLKEAKFELFTEFLQYFQVYEQFYSSLEKPSNQMIRFLPAFHKLNHRLLSINFINFSPIMINYRAFSLIISIILFSLINYNKLE